MEVWVEGTPQGPHIIGQLSLRRAGVNGGFGRKPDLLGIMSKKQGRGLGPKYCRHDAMTIYSSWVSLTTSCNRYPKGRINYSIYFELVKTAKIACIATVGTPSISRVPEAWQSRLPTFIQSILPSTHCPGSTGARY